MTSAEGYRSKAAEFSAMARLEQSPALQIEYAKMAAAYIRLAEMAERNAENGVLPELPFDQKPTAP
jgi:hypothetical protein